MKQPLATFIHLDGKRCTVIGGGQLAERRVKKLLEAGAMVQLISPDLTQALQELKEVLEYEQRGYLPGDGQGAFLVVAATNKEELNQAIYEEHKDTIPLINIVDDPHKSTFHFPAVVQRGRLQIAITTSGSSPSLTKQISEGLEEEYGEEYEEYLELLYELRIEAKQKIKSPSFRKQFLKELLSLDILTLLKNRENELLVSKINKLCQSYWHT